MMWWETREFKSEDGFLMQFETDVMFLMVVGVRMDSLFTMEVELLELVEWLYI